MSTGFAVSGDTKIQIYIYIYMYNIYNIYFITHFTISYENIYIYILYATHSVF